MKSAIRIFKKIILGLGIFIGVILLTFSLLKWVASDDIRIAVGKKFPLLMMIDNQPINEQVYLGNKNNDPSIYENKSSQNIYPLIKFTQNLTDVKKLCLFDFTGDNIYKSFELQQVQQENKNYYVLIAYRQDEVVDIYYDKGLKVNEDNYKALMNQVSLMETNFSKINFDVTEKGLNAYVEMIDKQNRKIEFKVKENKTSINKDGIIAPIGERGTNPEYFPIIYLKNFNFVEQNYVDIAVNIGGKNLEPEKLIPLFNYKRVYLSRYSDSNNIKRLNPNYSGVIKPVEVSKDADEVKFEDNSYLITENDGHPEIKQVKSIYENSEMRLTFSPALPDLSSLKDNTQVQGRFSLGVDEVTGIMGGEYSIDKSNGSIKFQLKPQEGWQPMPGTLWMKTYLWNCNVKLDGENLIVDSKWTRTEAK